MFPGWTSYLGIPSGEFLMYDPTTRYNGPIPTYPSVNGEPDSNNPIPISLTNTVGESQSPQSSISNK
jgi:hypothetical protein